MGLFFPLLCSLVPLPEEKIVSEKKKGESALVHLDFHSGKKEQWEGNRMLSLWFILAEPNSSLSILFKAYF